MPTDDPNVGDGEVKPLEIELWFVSGNTDSERVCQVVAQSWNSIGVKTTVKNQDVSTIWGPEGYQFTEEDDRLPLLLVQRQRPDRQVLLALQPDPEDPDRDRRQSAGLLSHSTASRSEIDELTDGRRRHHRPGEAEEDLLRRSRSCSTRRCRSSSSIGRRPSRPPTKNIGGFWPSAFNYLLWNANEWYLT